MFHVKPINWHNYKNFSEKEFICSHSGLAAMHSDFLEVLQAIRDEYASPMIVTSGYRHVSHPIEKVKQLPGEHTYGLAADILVSGENALYLMEIALAYGIRRLGIHQKGTYDQRFIHIGIGNEFISDIFPEAIWTY